MSGRRVRALKTEYIAARREEGDLRARAAQFWQVNRRRVKRAYRARKGA